MRVCCGGTDGRRMNQTAPGAVVAIKEICRPEIREGLKSPSCRNLSKRGNRDPQTLPGSGDRPDVGSDAARLPGRWHLTYIQPNLPSLVRGDCGHRPRRRLPLKVKNQRRCTRHDADFLFFCKSGDAAMHTHPQVARPLAALAPATAAVTLRGWAAR